MEKRPDPVAAAAKLRPRQKFPVPWGLFIALGVYALGVTGYIWVAYWSSPEYQAAEHYNSAWEILGRDEGRKAPREQMLEAYEHLLEAARLMPQVKSLHDQLESLNWRFEERKLRLPPEYTLRAGAVASVWQRIQAEQQPILVVGARNRGWAPDQLADGPATTVKWSMIGVLIIVVIWAWGRFNGNRLRAVEHEQELRKMEREVKELAQRPAPRPRRPAP
jgi:hypothetical protein